MDGRTQLHLDAAERHKNLAPWLLHSPRPPDLTSYPDEWVVTILFYSAVHLISAYLMERAGPGSIPRSHAERFAEVGRRPELRSIVMPYTELYDWSIAARYAARPTFAATDLQAASDDRDRIARVISQLLGVE
ncbi:MAG TPA: hypothetical protein VMU89_07970 [Thermomicrobiaceae bacterium]|nr:hypothetical protein [Thermomicrobiaceae bacterium]